MEILKGVAKILLKHNVPLLPVALIDTHIAWGKHKKMKPFTKMTVKIGKTIYPKEYLPESTLPESEQIEHIKKIYIKALIELLPEHQKPES